MNRPGYQLKLSHFLSTGWGPLYWIHRFMIFVSVLGALTFLSIPSPLYSEMANITTIAFLPLMVIMNWLSYNSVLKKKQVACFS